MYGVWDTGERENECMEYVILENGRMSVWSMGYWRTGE